MQNNALPVWIIAVALSVFVVTVLAIAAFCLLVQPAMQQQQEYERRQRIIRQEPWRQWEPNNGFQH